MALFTNYLCLTYFTDLELVALRFPIVAICLILILLSMTLYHFRNSPVSRTVAALSIYYAGEYVLRKINIIIKSIEF